MSVHLYVKIKRQTTCSCSNALQRQISFLYASQNPASYAHHSFPIAEKFYSTVTFLLALYSEGLMEVKVADF